MYRFWARWIAVMAIATSMWGCSRPSAGFVELQRSREAIRAAKSWQNGTTSQIPSGQWVIAGIGKVECPGRFDRVSIFHDQGNRSVHEIWYDGTYYNKTNGVGTWGSLPASSMPFTECGKGPSLVWDGTLFEDLETVERVGEFRRGKAEKVEDGECTWWDVVADKSMGPHYSVCVGENDQLPRTVRSHEHNMNYVYSFTHWNETTVSLPADITVLPD